MGRRKKKRHGQSDVELNLAAMLDMAFQLLTFFILTFRPAPVEGQISLRLPPPQAVKGAKDAPPPPGVKSESPVEGVNTLTITVVANPVTGLIDNLGVGEAQVPSVAALSGRLREVFSDQGNPFDQVLISVSGACRYDELMRVVEACTRQEIFQDGKKQKLSKLSFVEMPGG